MYLRRWRYIYNFVSYISEEKLILIPVLYLLGMILKSIKVFNSKYIPLVLIFIGIILATLLGPFTIKEVTNSIIQGILVAGAAVLSNQVYKQIHVERTLLSEAQMGNLDQIGEDIIINSFDDTNTELMNNNLINMNNSGVLHVPVKIYLDAGHGGNDPGVVYNGYKEKDLNLEAVLYIGNRLTELGFEVGYSRTTDINPGEVFSRGTKGKGYNYFLSIHCNAGGGTGAEIIVNCKETGAEIQSNYRTELSRLGNFRKIYSRKYSNGSIIERTIENNKFTNIVNDLDWYGVLRGSWSGGVTGDLLELFFLDNSNDLNNYLLKKHEYFEAIIKSICFTHGVEYKETENKTSSKEEITELKEQIESLNQTVKEKDNLISALQSELSMYTPITFYEKN